jgi:hypothetical protein
MNLLLSEYKTHRFKLLLLLLYMVFLFLENLKFGYSQTIATIEQYFTILPAIMCCLILSNNDEVELFLSYKIKKTNLFFNKYLVFCLSTLLIGIIGDIIFLKTEYIFSIVLSYIITTLFIITLAIFCRLLLRNSFGCVGILLFTFLYSVLQSSGIKYYKLPIWMAYLDPYITQYMLNNQMWYINRLSFLSAFIIMFIVCYILVRREKLFNL